MPGLDVDHLTSYRSRTFRTKEDLRLRSENDAVDYVNERGMIFFWPVKGVIFPSLWAATAGDRPIPDEHDDPGHVTWGWKDGLLGKRRVFYSRLLNHRNTFVSLDVLPYFYALSPNYGDWENDYLEQYELGQMTLECRLVYEALLKQGTLDTISLRKAAHMSGEGSDSRFNHALDILQYELKILPVGIAEVGAWRYAFIYDIVARYFPNLQNQARSIGEEEAQRLLIKLYFLSVGAAPHNAPQKLFRWPVSYCQRAINRLIESGFLLPGVSLPDKPGEHLALAKLA